MMKVIEMWWIAPLSIEVTMLIFGFLHIVELLKMFTDTSGVYNEKDFKKCRKSILHFLFNPFYPYYCFYRDILKPFHKTGRGINYLFTGKL